jgi:flagellar assembly factor FliW
MRIETRTLGAVEVTPESFVTLPEGLVGYEGEREYALVEPDRFAPFRWLLSFSDPDLTLPLLPANLAVPEYAPQFANADRRAIGAVESDVLELYVVASLDPSSQLLTVNLRAPIIVHPGTRLGRQVVLSDGRYGIDHPIPGTAPQVEARGAAIKHAA